MPSFYINSPELFKNIAQLDCAGNYYDFHNEFVCTKLMFEQESLTLTLKHSVTDLNVSLIFSDVTIAKVELLYKEAISQSLTLDNLYRGRYQIDDSLYEYDSKKRSYYYLEFYEGYKMEFFGACLQLKI